MGIFAAIKVEEDYEYIVQIVIAGDLCGKRTEHITNMTSIRERFIGMVLSRRSCREKLP